MIVGVAGLGQDSPWCSVAQRGREDHPRAVPTRDRSGPAILTTPHPTVSDLQSPWAGLGYEANDVDADAAVKAVQKRAARYNVRLPAPPARAFGDQVRLIWATLAAVEVSTVVLRTGEQKLTGMLQRGGAICNDLRRYNAAAIETWRVNDRALRALQEAKVPGVPDYMPYPDLFWGVGASASDDDGLIDCSQTVVSFAPEDMSRGVVIGNRPPIGGRRSDLRGTELSGVFLLLLLGGAAFAAVTAFWSDIAAWWGRVRQAMINADFAIDRISAVERMTDRCASGAVGQAYIDCLNAVNEAIPEEPPEIPDEPGKHGALWWGGLIGLVAMAGIGYYALSRPRRER